MRLVTRPDLDGLTCAVLLSKCERIDSIALVHPQDVAERRVDITAADVLTNVPYHPACGLWFDNHLLTDARSTPPAGFRGRYAQAPSAARVVYDHYEADQPALSCYAALLAETDRLDSANLTREDVLSPDGYVLLGFTLDDRTGLDGLHEYFLALSAVRDRLSPRFSRFPRSPAASPACASRTARSGTRRSSARGCRAGSSSPTSADSTRCR